jgi:hypothetical protein
LPGSILNQVEAPEGWGSGIRSASIPESDRIGPVPTHQVVELGAPAEVLGELGDGELAHRDDEPGPAQLQLPRHQPAQLRTSGPSGTRSPPLGFLPGKQRHTALIRTRVRT